MNLFKIPVSDAESAVVKPNSNNTFLAEGTTIFMIEPANFLIKAPRKHPELIILDICALLSSKFCLAVNNGS